MKQGKKAYLILENGRVFEGWSYGYEGNSTGEAVFTTGMCGYLETLTDPSYYGQIVVQTFPLIGNYGVIPADFEGKCRVRGYVAREFCDTPSNFRSVAPLREFLTEQKIPAICGVDTREITRILRESGTMNARITTDPADLADLGTYRVRHAVAAVSPQETVRDSAGGRFRVALLDCGAKANIARELRRRGCAVDTYPALTPASQILADHPDGIMLSNGPGDPVENTEVIATVRELLGKVPLFGICLGHQLTALALGGRTVKLHYGHRGVNQPARDTVTGRTYMTSQNHGYAVVAGSVPAGRERFINVNDGTVEGMDYPEYRAYTVQFHPEACAGPQDTSFLFDRLIAMMEEDRHA